MVTILSLLASAYALLVLGMYVFQRRLMYLPDTRIQHPSNYGLHGFEEHFVPSTDNVTLQLWYKPAEGSMPTVMYYHGNASHLGDHDRAALFSKLADNGFGVLAVSYRGYGKSTGSPHEQGLYDDARRALAFLTEEKKLPLQQIVIFGESLGTGVAVHMASEYAVRALVLQAPYTSVAGRAAEIYRYIPVRWLIRDKYHSLDKIGNVRTPLLLFHGEKDDTIPVEHGRTLFHAANYPKHGHFLPGINHTDFDSGFIVSELKQFLVRYCGD